LAIATPHASLTLAKLLLQYEVFVNITYIPSEARFSHYAKIKKAISSFTLINIRLMLNDIPVLKSFYIVSAVYVQPSNYFVIAYVALG